MNAEQRFLRQQAAGRHALVADAAAVLETTKQRVVVPLRNIVHLLEAGVEPPPGNDVLLADNVVVIDTRAAFSRRVLPPGTRFWVEVK